MLIIGSRAAKEIFQRVPKDIDILGTENECLFIFEKLQNRIFDLGETSYGIWFKYKNRKNKTSIIEFEIIEKRESSKLLLEKLNIEEGDIKYANKDTLLLLKESHKYLKNSPHFLKTMNDIHILRKNGAVIKYPEIFALREKETYNYKHPDLTKKKEDFFEKKETFYKYDHDDIHKSVAVGSYPVYIKFLKDNEPVFCDKTKFFNLTEDERLNAVMEESFVLALERSLIPFEFKTDPDKAFKTALMKVCSSITSGWFREFAWENYYKVIDKYNNSFKEYPELFKRALNKGKISEFKR